LNGYYSEFDSESNDDVFVIDMISGNATIVNTLKEEKGIFVYKNSELYSVSNDDFSHDFLTIEKTRLVNNYERVKNKLETLGGSDIPVIPDEDGVS
jgi:hypothetical protein